MINKTVKVLSLASLAATTAFGALPSAQAKDADRAVVFVAAHHEKEKCKGCKGEEMKKCNPCAAEKCNPCAAKKCNPCAAKKCNPCAAEKEKKEKK